MEDSRRLLVDIARCPVVDEIHSGRSKSSPCQRIVSLQSATSFHLPEPWSGRIDTAPILFISSNPSIDENEVYPDQSWSEDQTTEFFQNRFTSAAGWVEEGLYALLRDGTRTPWVRFWASARARASEILDKDKGEIVPGIDFALTEVVHCKSRKEEGVKEAQEYCSQRYLKSVLTISAAKIFVVYGKVAKGEVRRYFGSSLLRLPNHLESLSVGGHSRIIAFLPAPNARGGEKSLRANIGDAGLSRIRRHLSQPDTPSLAVIPDVNA